MKGLHHEPHRHSFRRWAELIESGRDRSDTQRSADLVLVDIRDQTKSASESEAVFEALKHFLKERPEARHQSVNVVDIGNIRYVDRDVK